ncbi:MAG: TonB family protein [Deltaproteobacteria bacterium]|nr:TonB family protein [Deltaproteobacteria bacterium]
MQTLLRESKKGFWKPLAGSFAFHILVISAGVFIFSAEPKRVFTPAYTVSLVAPGEVKGPEPAVVEAPPAPTPVPQPEPKALPKEKPMETKKAEPEKKVIIPAKKDAVSFDDTFKRITENVKRRQEAANVASSIESIKKKKDEEAKATARKLDELKKEINSKYSGPAPVVKQDVAGLQASGSRGESSLRNSEQRYGAMVGSIINDNWTIYEESLKIDKVSVILSLKIDRNGNLLDNRIKESSGNARFDEMLLKAVKKASPFPPFPKDLKNTYIEGDFRYCPSCPRDGR